MFETRPTPETEPKSEDLLNLPHRQEALAAIPRYNLYKVMYYRGSVLDHTERLGALVRALAPYATSAFGEDFDVNKAELIAYTHDDIEIKIGDVQQGNKSKMSQQELAELNNQENSAANELAEEFPKTVLGYNYRDILHANDVKSLESQFNKFIDCLDAYCEALHEIYAGNVCFVTNVVNERGRIDTPTENYLKIFKGFLDKYPDMAPLFEQDLPISLVPVERNFKAIAHNGTPHTLDSFRQPSEDAHYNFWKQTMIKNNNIIDITKLCTQIEFPSNPPKSSLAN